MNIIEREHQSIFQVYKRLPIIVDRAEGCYIYDTEGNRWLDFLAGIAVNALGHSHPKLVEAVKNQAEKYMHISNYFYQEPQVKLAEQLLKISNCSKVFFTNSGTEATEGAIKLARRWGSDINKTEIVAFSGGFHGRTYGALSIMDKPQYKDKMGPFLQNTKILKYNSIEDLEANLNENTLAVVLEFTQGEGGITSASPEFVDKINELRTKFGFLVIADEIQAGTGRTGKYFGFNHYDFQPDIITLAKGMGGGMPLGAVIAQEKLESVWEKGMHGTTYGGNAVACAAGSVVLDELSNGLLEKVNETGNYFIEKLNELKSKYPSKIEEIRGRGLMLGVVLKFDAVVLVQEMLKHKVISNAASGTVLRIVPPLNISIENINEFLSVLDKSLEVL